MSNYAYRLINILENRQKMVKTRLEIGMNNLAGRLTKRPDAFSVCLCMVKDTANILYSQLIYVYCLVNILENQGKMVETTLEIGIRYE